MRKLYKRDTRHANEKLKPGFHIVVSVVSVARKKSIGQIEFILSRTASCICRILLYSTFVQEVSIKLYLSYEFFSYDRHDSYDRYNDMESRLYEKANEAEKQTNSPQTEQ